MIASSLLNSQSAAGECGRLSDHPELRETGFATPSKTRRAAHNECRFRPPRRESRRGLWPLAPIKTSLNSNQQTSNWYCLRPPEASAGFGVARDPPSNRSQRPTTGVACAKGKPAKPAWGLGPLAGPSRTRVGICPTALTPRIFALLARPRNYLCPSEPIGYLAQLK
jgi:hypothetical protein